MFKKVYEKYHLIIGLVLLFIIGLYINEKQKLDERKINAEIDKSLDFSIAKVKDYGKSYNHYIYYYDNKKYQGSYKDGRSSLIGKFFVVELSKRNPESSRLRIDKEIKDSVRIANAGFRKKTLDEILEMK